MDAPPDKIVVADVAANTVEKAGRMTATEHKAVTAFNITFPFTTELNCIFSRNDDGIAILDHDILGKILPLNEIVIIKK